MYRCGKVKNSAPTSMRRTSRIALSTMPRSSSVSSECPRSVYVRVVDDHLHERPAHGVGLHVAAPHVGDRAAGSREREHRVGEVRHVLHGRSRLVDVAEHHAAPYAVGVLVPQAGELVGAVHADLRPRLPPTPRITVTADTPWMSEDLHACP